jgi:hypothetical protein
MCRAVSILLGAGLIVLCIAGLSHHAPAWLACLDGAGALVAFGAAVAFTGAGRRCQGERPPNEPRATDRRQERQPARAQALPERRVPGRSPISGSAGGSDRGKVGSDMRRLWPDPLAAVRPAVVGTHDSCLIESEPNVRTGFARRAGTR